MDEMRYKVENQKDIEEIEEGKEKNKTRDISSFFENFIKKNKFIKEYDFGNDFKVSMHPCTTGELMEAELFVRGQNPGIPVDTMIKLRSAAILSQAIDSLCGVKIEDPAQSEDDIMLRRTTLYTKILSLPPDLVEKMYECYLDVVDKQAELYKNPLKLDKEIENF